MKPFEKKFTNLNSFIELGREPDFNNLLCVLKKQRPARPTLFEFFLNNDLNKQLTQHITYCDNDTYAEMKRAIDAFRIASYDYATLPGSDFRFMTDRHKAEGTASISLNEGAVIRDRESFENYEWPDPDQFDYSRLKDLADYLPAGMKLIIQGPDGVLETVVNLVGYENLCYMTVDEPDLTQAVFDAVGSRFVRYYEICSSYDTVGALISNDDWGFNTQTFLPVGDMRKYVVPWHKKIADTIHAAGKPAILHSCGMTDLMADDIVNYIGYDAKHSYEDKIRPVEQAYGLYRGKIAVLGGIDVDFICRSSPEEVYARAASMLERTSAAGGYALGSGNSIPDYVPVENYLAMTAAAVFS